MIHKEKNWLVDVGGIPTTSEQHEFVNSGDYLLISYNHIFPNRIYGKNHVPNHQPETHGTSAGDFTIFGDELQP